MVGRLLDGYAGAIFRSTLRTLQEDIARELHRDAWTLWQRDRPLVTWDTGDAAEGWRSLASGLGKLYEQGAGGPQMSEGIVHPDSPYRLRTATALLPADPDDGTAAPDRTHLYLVLNAARFFAVDAIKREAEADALATIYLRELFGMPLPKEASASPPDEEDPDA